MEGSLADWSQERLRRIEKDGTERHVKVWPHDYAQTGRTGTFGTPEVASIPEAPLLNFASNDYLGLSSHPRLASAAGRAMDEEGVGAGASRVVSGTRPDHASLERALAAWLGTEGALVCGAGYLANQALCSALVGRDDTIISDQLVHASLIDGISVTRCRHLRFRHNDPESLRSHLQRVVNPQRTLVICESVYSMDGDLAPLPDVVSIVSEAGASLFVDEAHALGVFGPRGAGLACLAGARNIALSGSFAKAFGCYGGFLAGGAPLMRLVISSGRSFIFNTALPPLLAAAAEAALGIITEADEARERILAHAAMLRDAFRAQGLTVLPSASQIVPLHVGDAARALELARLLRARGILVPAIRRPTVPPGGERLRFSVTALHTAADIERTAAAVFAAARSSGIL